MAQLSFVQFNHFVKLRVMRKALIVGIDYYTHVNRLDGCVNDAFSVRQVLERHGDGTKNFDVMLKTASDSTTAIDKKELKSLIADLFDDETDVALLYFAGHGYIDSDSGYLITSDCKAGADGVSMDEIMSLVNKSRSKNKVVILDCCHSGQFGNVKALGNSAVLSEGTTILTASARDQYAAESDGKGLFTSLLVDAMNGSAANLVGEISPGSVYAHIDRSLGAWSQRPIFKTNVRSFISLRKVNPPITLEDLKKIDDLFPDKGYEFPLDPTFEPTSGKTIETNAEKFRILQKYNRLNLVVPVGAEHMYFAAMESKSCKLTILGEHYWTLVKEERI